jgi:hypothetical protein
MKNGKVNTYPARIARDQAKTVAAGMPMWWTAADEVDRNAARLGCQEPDRECVDCRVACCPEARRMCRTCASWQSGSGECGKCERNGLLHGRAMTCEHWRARE